MNGLIHQFSIFLTFDSGSFCRETIITPLRLKCNPPVTWHNPQSPTVPLPACKNNLLWIKSKGPCQRHDVTVLRESNPALPPPHLQRGVETFLAFTLLTLKEAPRGDISIQETCWHTYQTSQRQVSFPGGPYGSNRDVKGQPGPKYHKRMKGYQHALTESKDSKGGGGGGGWNAAFWGWCVWWVLLACVGGGGFGSISAKEAQS